ncbi:bacteriocin [Methylomonas methanica]|nr:bacteriocin [Methylomonas methanica]
MNRPALMIGFKAERFDSRFGAAFLQVGIFRYFKGVSQMNAQSDQSFRVLNAEELQNVSGGWCGTTYPGFWKGPKPGPLPDLFNSAVSRLSTVSLNPQPLPPAEIGFFIK